MTSHHLNQWWFVYWCIYTSLGLNDLTHWQPCFQGRGTQYIEQIKDTVYICESIKVDTSFRQVVQSKFMDIMEVSLNLGCSPWKLDESTARRQLKSPRSLSGRSIHLTLVTKWSWSWSWMTYCHTLCAMSISPPILRYSYFKIWPWKSMVKVICVVKGQGHVWPWKFKGQGYGQGQTWWSHLRPWSSIDMFAFRFVAIRSFLAEI